jgi:hypothetical protein
MQARIDYHKAPPGDQLPLARRGLSAEAIEPDVTAPVPPIWLRGACRRALRFRTCMLDRIRT